MSINTINSREQQLRNGYFQSGTGPKHILVLGSCRTIAFTSYLLKYNEKNEFTIRRIDVCDWNWDLEGNNVDIQAVLERCKTDERILSAFRDTKIFIHEHLGNYGMFNTDRNAEENIFQYGMNPDQDISIPNFHDHFILYNDFVDFNALTDDWAEKGEASIKKFCDLCMLTSFPEMGEYVRDNWRKIRFFWRPNHTAATFTLKIFELMNDKFLHLDLSEDFWNQIKGEDIFKHPHTQVHRLDEEAYGISW